MTWTAVFKDATPVGTAWNLLIVFTDGVQAVKRQYSVQSLSDEVVEQLARSEIIGLEKVADSVGKVSYALDDVIDLTSPATSKPADPVPSAAEIAFIKFKTDYLAWQRATRGVAAGLVKQADADALLATVQSEYLPEYADIL